MHLASSLLNLSPVVSLSSRQFLEAFFCRGPFYSVWHVRIMYSTALHALCVLKCVLIHSSSWVCSAELYKCINAAGMNTFMMPYTPVDQWMRNVECKCFSDQVFDLSSFHFILNVLCLVWFLVVMIVCVHACVAQPSAALGRVGSAQQGAWSLGSQRRCVD